LEWNSILGPDLLGRLLGISPSSVRRYRGAARTTPDDVAGRLHFLSLVVADLSRAYNDIGVRQWFNRKISSSRVVKPTNNDEERSQGLDPFFRQFFGNDFSQHFSVPRDRVEKALGSGVIVSPEGYILTNSHVVADVKEVTVTLSDKREMKAQLIGTDPRTDIAVVKIDGSNFPALTLGDSSKVQVGDVVLAVGDPFGVGETVTNGIVSALSRGGLGIEGVENFIQTDAPINPGNSGGALVDDEGHLIGINTAIVGNSGGSQGIGFAVPLTWRGTTSIRSSRMEKSSGATSAFFRRT
jgi:S1-C subfamily serine protease